ncbi:MAG: tetratricopeptide repeat protein [Candidatus Micrarchaeota archaeon]|nr:tetratricopeptide repeat protein [Candidatus Micrarchaeota archaeon]
MKGSSHTNREYPKKDSPNDPPGDSINNRQPENLAAAYFNRGLSKAMGGDYKAAIEDYTKAIELNPNFAAAYSNRGSAKAKLGDTQGAKEDYEKAKLISKGRRV